VRVPFIGRRIYPGRFSASARRRLPAFGALVESTMVF